MEEEGGNEVKISLESVIVYIGWKKMLLLRIILHSTEHKRYWGHPS